MATSQNGPVPTRLTLLSDLRECLPGDKVRFLGCVTSYSIETGVLTLEHDHPPGRAVRALVDVGLVTGTMKPHETRVGEWVNVIAYIKPGSPTKAAVANYINVHLQALILWSSESLNLQSYERSLDRQTPFTDTFKS